MPKHAKVDDWFVLREALEPGRRRLRAYMRSGRTLAEVSRASGVSESSLAAFLNRSSNLSLPSLFALSVLLDIPLWEFLAPIDSLREAAPDRPPEPGRRPSGPKR
jgi:transcriptional regulator with XRE-family HTH domain